MRWLRCSLCAIGVLVARPGGAQPAVLACLARHYAVVPERTDAGAWLGRLPGGTALAYDELAAMFEQHYPRGPVEPVVTLDMDPGRVRVEALFAATYGDPPVPDDLVSVPFFGTRMRVHRRIAPALERVVQHLGDPELRRFLVHAGGGYARRNVAHSSRASPHAYGIAVDIGTTRADYWLWAPERARTWRNRIPEAIVRAFEAEGFIWGGRWYHFDTMHFEYRPELLDDACYP
jgi:hypothetical protein